MVLSEVRIHTFFKYVINKTTRCKSSPNKKTVLINKSRHLKAKLLLVEDVVVIDHTLIYTKQQTAALINVPRHSRRFSTVSAA